MNLPISERIDQYLREILNRRGKQGYLDEIFNANLALKK